MDENIKDWGIEELFRKSELVDIKRCFQLEIESEELEVYKNIKEEIKNREDKIRKGSLLEHLYNLDNTTYLGKLNERKREHSEYINSLTENIQMYIMLLDALENTEFKEYPRKKIKEMESGWVGLSEGKDPKDEVEEIKNWMRKNQVK